MVKDILKLGDPALYETCAAVLPEEWPQLPLWEQDLLDTLLWYRATYSAGRAIAAPQIGIPKRIILLCIDTPILLVNPSLSFPNDEMMEVLDDCMSFPGLCVTVLRHRRVTVHYTDRNRQTQQMALEGDLAELIQHEYDHLDGILATMRAKDNRSFYLMQMKR